MQSSSCLLDCYAAPKSTWLKPERALRDEQFRSGIFSRALQVSPQTNGIVHHKNKKIVLLPILWLLEASGYLTSTEFRPRFAASATSATVVAMVSKSTEPTGIETSYHL